MQSAAGAASNSHGCKAVGSRNNLDSERRRCGISVYAEAQCRPCGPRVLKVCISTTASRPRLFNVAPSALKTHISWLSQQNRFSDLVSAFPHQAKATV